MSNRLGFRAFLLKYVKDMKNLYFQPPENQKMKYPCIIYNLTRDETVHADNIPYRITPVYEVILVDADPDSPFMMKLMEVPGRRFVRFYTADNLNHWVFQIPYTGIFPSANS